MAQIKKKNATQYGTVNIFQVILKEIDRFYDFDYAGEAEVITQRVAVVGGRPQIVYGKWSGEWSGKTWNDERQAPDVVWKWKYFDQEGRDLVPGDVTLLQRQVERDQWSPGVGGRTFWREDSKSPKNCWVYVFQSKPGCRDPKLHDELFFDEEGLVERVDGAEWKRAKEIWQRGAGKTAEGTKSDETKRSTLRNPKQFHRLELTKELFDKEWYLACYHFYLAPQQLPLGAIEEIMRDLPNRAVSFNDDFYTDIFLSYDTKTTAPKVPRPGVSSNLPKLAQAIDTGVSLGRGVFVNHVIHLPNPIKEAELRAQALASVLERREKLLDEKERADKDRCILARQIEQLTQHDPAMREKVRPKLDNYLEADRLARLLIITEICARELVCWITRLERCSAPSWEKFVYSPPEGVTTLGEAAFAKSKTRPPPDGIGRGTWPGSPFANPYAEAIRYYTHAPVENSSAILETVGAVMADLPKTLVGQSWLSDNLKSVLSLTEGGLRQRVEGGERGWKKPANGGLDFFFLLNSQPGKVANKTAAAFHAIHAAAWEKRHPNFVKFINEYNEVQEAKGQDQLSVHSRTLNQVKGLVQTFGVLQSALSVAAEIVKLHEKVKKGDGELEDWCRLSSKVGKTLASAESSIATWVMVATGKRVGIRAFSFAGAYGDACALLLGMVDYANSYEPAERTGRGIELAGMGLELAITYFGPSLVGGPWTLVLGLMVWAIMFAGETYRKEKNQAALFLKECEFGRSSRLGWAIMEQRRELEPIMYNFVWNLESDKWLNVAVAAKRGDAEAEKRLRRGFRPWLYLVIKPQYPHVCLSAYWTWKVKMLVEIPGMGMKLNVSFTASRKGLEQGDTASFPAQLRLKKDGLYYAVCEIDPALYPGEASFAQVTATGKVLLSVEGSLCQSDFRSAEEETRSTISTMVGLMTP